MIDRQFYKVETKYLMRKDYPKGKENNQKLISFEDEFYRLKTPGKKYNVYVPKYMILEQTEEGYFELFTRFRVVDKFEYSVGYGVSYRFPDPTLEYLGYILMEKTDIHGIGEVFRDYDDKQIEQIADKFALFVQRGFKVKQFVMDEEAVRAQEQQDIQDRNELRGKKLIKKYGWK